MIEVTCPNVMSYMFTPGKKYPVVELVSKTVFKVRCDTGRIVVCLFKNDADLDLQDWILPEGYYVLTEREAVILGRTEKSYLVRLDKNTNRVYDLQNNLIGELK